MENKRRIRHLILNLLLSPALFISCSGIQLDTPTTKIRISLSGECYETKALDPEEDKIEDVHIYVFSEEGELEYSQTLHSRDLKMGKTSDICELELLKGRNYEAFACANLGFIPSVRNRMDLDRLVCHLAYPDDYRKGIPMSCRTGLFQADKDKTVRLKFRRLMSKISLKIDRSKLSEDVEILVRKVRIGNCPRNAKLFCDNSVSSRDDLFPNGFVRNEEECEVLNRKDIRGQSEELSLYMLENLQGRIEEADGTPAGKVFSPSDGRAQTASYIEISLDYLSSRYFTESRPLLYRFWLGEDHRDVNVERNCHYHIRVSPQGDGLGAEGWRIDKTGLRESYEQISFRIMPGRYLSGHPGEDLHVWCEYSPYWAPFNIGMEELEEDRRRGLYDYTVDDDGKGVVLHLKRPGQGILYMEAGAPVNRSDMVVVEVTLP